VTKYRDEVNNVRYRLDNVEKGQKYMNDKIDRLLEGGNKIDTLIEQVKKILELSENRWNDKYENGIIIKMKQRENLMNIVKKLSN
jgi:hypothetical protein